MRVSTRSSRRLRLVRRLTISSDYLCAILRSSIEHSTALVHCFHRRCINLSFRYHLAAQLITFHDLFFPAFGFGVSFCYVFSFGTHHEITPKTCRKIINATKTFTVFFFPTSVRLRCHGSSLSPALNIHSLLLWLV